MGLLVGRKGWSCCCEGRDRDGLLVGEGVDCYGEGRGWGCCCEGRG